MVHQDIRRLGPWIKCQGNSGRGIGALFFRLSLEEQTTFGGLTCQFSTLMICPEFLDHVKQEMEKEAALSKNLRKEKPEEGQPWQPSATPLGPESGRHTNRELFPLPSVHVEERIPGKLSRKCRQRAGHRRHIQEEVQATVTALNFLHGGSGFSGGHHSRGAGTSAGQFRCL